MAAYVTVDELRDVLGVGTLYPDATLEIACTTATETLQQYLWFDSYPVIGCTVQNNVVTLVLSAAATYTVGQTITVSGVGSVYNGSRTITATYPWSQGSGSFPLFTYFFPYTYYTFPKGYSLIQYNATGTVANENYRQVVPYGKALGADTKTSGYSTIPAIRQAALNLAVDVWQARQAPSSGGVSVDGVTPSPYRLGNTMLAKVRGLIAPYTSPRSMVG